MYNFVRSRAVSVATGAVFFAALFSVAPVAQAATLSATQISAITNLLQAFGADPAVVANVQSVLEGTSTSTPAVQPPVQLPTISGTLMGGNGCNVVSGDLRPGVFGAEVSRLQAFLGKDKSIYPEGSVTGHFGPMTEEAVQRWQSSHGIVATGTPATTGFGVVGPRTLREMDREMEMECENGDTGSVTASSTSSESSASVEGTAVTTTGDSTASSTSSHDN